MPNEDRPRVEVITGVAGRRYWPAQEKLRIVEESLAPGESVSAVARRNGVAPNLLFRWRRLMAEGGAMAVGRNEPVVGASEVRRLEDKVRTRAPQPIEHLSDNGSAYTAKQTRDFAVALNLVPCFTPVRSPESNGIAEAFVKTFKRNYVRVSSLPEAPIVLRQIAGWIEDYNTVHPHSALRMRSPSEVVAALNP